MPEEDQFKHSTPIRDERVLTVLAQLNASRRHPDRSAFDGPSRHDPNLFADYGFSIHPDQGDLIYLLCRAMGAKRVVDFATSIGMSAIYFATAVRDNGGGIVVGAELVQAKVDMANANLSQAGLRQYAEIRVGDARETLRNVGGLVDFALIDGWPVDAGPSLARQIIEIIAPQLRLGGYVMNDNAEPDFLEYIRDPRNGFISVTLPIKRGTELALKVSN